ncbi:MAG TPA: DUF5615 family PIN-like protein [Chitinophagaceae bacterium]|nr:DUF5615 family PIN-like protein [Chitinophagaceae bacterium]
MKLLLDANISWRLTVKLKPHFGDCLHVDNIGLNTPASDIQIWNYALVNQLTIVTNDDDFLNFVNINGFPPKVILLRTLNQSNEYIEMLLIKHKSDIQSLFASEDYGLLEIF